MRKHKRKITRLRIVRVYDRILDKTYKDFTGGTQYGVDMPTLRAVYPARAKALDTLSLMFHKYVE